MPARLTQCCQLGIWINDRGRDNASNSADRGAYFSTSRVLIALAGSPKKRKFTRGFFKGAEPKPGRRLRC